MKKEVCDFISLLEHSISQDLVCLFKAKNVKVTTNFDERSLKIYIHTSAIVRGNNVDSEFIISYYYITKIINDDIVIYINAITALIVCETIGYKDKYQKIYRKCKYYDKKH